MKNLIKSAGFGRVVSTLSLVLALLVVSFGVLGSQISFAKSDPVVKGSVTICKVVEDASGHNVTGSQFSGITFTIPGMGALNSAVFTTPLTLSKKLFGSDSANAQCVTQSNINVPHDGVTFSYKQETMSNATGWLSPKYSDNNPGSDSNLFSFGHSHADGTIELSQSHPDATLVVLNQRSPLDLCFSTNNGNNNDGDHVHADNGDNGNSGNNGSGNDDEDNDNGGFICPAKLTVTKVVVNDNGGTAIVSNFPLTVGTTSVTSGATNIFAAGTYIVAESNTAGYAATFSGACDSYGHVTLTPGSVNTCTITNNDIQPKLTVTKVVVGDDGARTPESFPLFVGSTSVVTGAQVGINAGSYYVHETSAPNYTSSFGADCPNGLVTLGIGDVKTCTITNTFVPPQPPVCTPTDVVSDETNTTGGVADVDLKIINPGWTALIPGANWIWNVEPIADTTVDETQTFDKTFSVNGNVSSAILDIAADNGYIVRINGTQVGADPTEFNYRADGQDQINVASFLHPGVNTISFDVKNFGLPGTDVNSNPAGLLYKLHIVTDCAGSAPQQLKVYIYKFLTDGEGGSVQATSTNVDGGYQFPMVSTWKTANLDGGNSASGSYVLGNFFGGAQFQYEADTSPMDQPADYLTSEVTNDISPTSRVLPANADTCTLGDYQLKGYGMGDTLESALAATPTTTTPSFTGITTDKTIVVYNHFCGPVPPPTEPSTVTVTLIKYLNGYHANSESADGKSFPMTATWSATNIGSGTGSFTLGPDGFFGSNAYEAVTSPMSVSANYTAFENTGGYTGILPIGAYCTPGAIRLDGYKWGVDLASAQSAELSSYAPNFANLSTNEVVLVMNEICPSTNDLSIYKTINNSTPHLGDTVTYSVTVTNNGPADASGVIVQDELPDGLTFVSANAPVGTSYSADLGQWTLYTLANGASKTLTITATVSDDEVFGTVITNYASVGEDESITDTNPENDNASAALTVTAAQNPEVPPGDPGVPGGGGQSADITIYKTVDNTTPAPGSTIHYTLTVKALGPYSSVDAFATDVLPPGVSLVMATTSQGYFNSSNGVWTIGTMNPGDTATLTITATVIAPVGTTFSNSARVGQAAGISDPQTGNNISTATTTVTIGGGSGIIPGEVLGASTSTQPTACSELYLPLDAYMGYGGHKNNPGYVKKLKVFLNALLHTNLTVNGTFDKATYDAVKLFQKTYSKDILQPWVPFGLSNDLPPTGYVYKTTLRWIDLLSCQALNLPIPPLP